jgi:hypothetical protein
MAFTFTPNGGVVEEFSDEARFSFNVAGLLVIDNGGERTIYAPGTWHSITTSTPVPVVR